MPAAERKRAEDAEAKLKKIEEQQEAELQELLKGIPEDKRPPLDDSDPIDKRLAAVKHTLALLGTPKPPVGAPFRKDDAANRKAELLKKGLNSLTADEAMELAELSE